MANNQTADQMAEQKAKAEAKLKKEEEQKVKIAEAKAKEEAEQKAKAEAEAEEARLKQEEADRLAEEEESKLTPEALKNMSKEQRNDALKARAKKNTLKPRDLNELMPSQMTVEEMSKHCKALKLEVAKNATPADMRRAIREYRDGGAKLGPR